MSYLDNDSMFRTWERIRRIEQTYYGGKLTIRAFWSSPYGPQGAKYTSVKTDATFIRHGPPVSPERVGEPVWAVWDNENKEIVNVFSSLKTAENVIRLAS